MTYPDRGQDNGQQEDEEMRSIWVRGAIMLFLIFCFGIAQSVLTAIALAQFFWMLISRERNVFLADLGYSLGPWMAETANFIAAASERRPFPWNPWPAG